MDISLSLYSSYLLGEFTVCQHFPWDQGGPASWADCQSSPASGPGADRSLLWVQVTCSRADGAPQPVVNPGTICPGIQVPLDRSTTPASELGAACMAMGLPTPTSELRMGGPCQTSVSCVRGISAPASELRAAQSPASVSGCWVCACSSDPWDRNLPDPDGAVVVACGPAPPSKVDSWVTTDGRATCTATFTTSRNLSTGTSSSMSSCGSFWSCTLERVVAPSLSPSDTGSLWWQAGK